MRVPVFHTTAFSAFCCLFITACVQSPPTASFEGIKTSRLIIEKNSRSAIGTLPAQLADTMKLCWIGRDELFEGFKVGQQGNSITLNGPIIGDPPQRFLISFSEYIPLGYMIEMEYPKGSNYQFIRSRVIKDLRKLESGIKPCN